VEQKAALINGQSRRQPRPQPPLFEKKNNKKKRKARKNLEKPGAGEQEPPHLATADYVN